MLFSTQQLARAHGLDEYSLKLTRGEVTQLIGFKANLKVYIGGIQFKQYLIHLRNS